MSKLQDLRRSKSLTQEGLARLAGLSVSTVACLERNSSRRPTWWTMSALARVYEMKLEEVVALLEIAEEEVADET